MKLKRAARGSGRKILLVDRAWYVLDAWGTECKKAKRVSVTATDLDGAITMARSERPQLAIVDQRIAFNGKADAVRALKKAAPNMFVIVVAAAMSWEDALRARDAGADDCCDKNVPIKRMIERAERRKPLYEEQRIPATYPTLAEVEDRYIARALADHDGNVSKTALALGIGRMTMYRHTDGMGMGDHGRSRLRAPRRTRPR